MKTFLIITFALTTMTTAQQPQIDYTLGMSRPSTHLFEVEISFSKLPAGTDTIDVLLPVWRPGRYVVLDFSGGIQEFSAVDANGKALQWTKREKSLWQVSARGSSVVTIRYAVYANEFNMRTRGLNDEHGFVDGSAVFMYVERFRRVPLTLTVKPYGSWHVTTGLEGEGKTFTAPDYDYFVDCPLEIGNQKDFSFSVEGTPHILSIYGEGNWNPDTLIRDISKIVAAQKAFWGKFPYKKYIFFLHCTSSGGGGTEHINSTIMGSRPYGFSNQDSYRGFLGLVSHEYFHTWNVKQLRPKGIHPYDYTKENYTKELWISEGTTSYYEELFLLRTGLMTQDKFIDNLAGTMRGDRQRPGNLRQSAADASFDAWVKYWKGTEQSNNLEADYYDKGSNISLFLDLEIRRRTQNKSSLDDVMRAMYERFPLSGPGYTVDDFRAVAEEFAGGKLGEFFEKFVSGTSPLPWEEYLQIAGLTVTSKDSVVKPWLGVNTTDAGDRARVTRVSAGSPGYDAGLDIGDEILALEGIRVRSSDLNDRIADRKNGDVVRLSVFHNDRLKDIKVTLAPSPVPSYKVAKSPSPDALQKSIYDGWLRMKQ